MRTMVGYAGSLSTLEGHQKARLAAKKRAEARDPKASVQLRRAEKELRRIVVWRGPREVA